MNELKPCPFCGGRARVIRLGHKNGTAFDDWGVECVKCGAMPKVITMYQFHDRETIERECARVWNRRDEPAPVTVGDKLRALSDADLARVIYARRHCGFYTECSSCPVNHADLYGALCLYPETEELISEALAEKLEGGNKNE